ncbi:uncharacterized protein EI90DRAFT_3040448 [Cantharellus anzutake]|uniref:uncharacterized protein n=1 Tax=Cantharellus anzutake TaxID=1750568 RepID=UPI001907D9FB|nr:uncharacterized protein EI90DRAFT_3040448 [Cantharellus anzutake]KAF8339124.1 hypothetical protein EI90DRAFT_3040448 [Cantharellus anzutake]
MRMGMGREGGAGVGGWSVNEDVGERSARDLGELLESIFPEYTGGRDMNKAAKFYFVEVFAGE